MKIKITKKLKCKRCEHLWRPRISDVRICPHCKTANWDKPRKKVTIK